MASNELPAEPYNGQGIEVPLASSAERRIENLFEHWARATPLAPAVQHRGVTLSYGDLDRRANQIAQGLQALGAGPGQLVGLCLQRSIDLIASVLGILKAGAAYLPLDPSYPADRLAYMLEDSGAQFLVTCNELTEHLKFSGKIFDLAPDTGVFKLGCDNAPSHSGTAQDLAYVIYTSGSTGRPKGVEIRHTPVALAEWMGSLLPEGVPLRVPFGGSICFDISVMEVLCTLCNGGVVIVKQNILEPFSPDERPTLLLTVPSLARELLHLHHVPESVQTIMCGGEALKNDLVRDLYALPHVERLYNAYGPTEATVTTTAALVPRVADDAEGDPCIGRPICGARVYVLDEDRQPVGPGVEGELYIAGPLLACGYRNDPERTAASFLPNPFGQEGERMYRTGDLVRVRPNGEIEYRGRLGEQIKLRGLRIELGEIETALLRLPNITAAAALVKPDEQGRDRLRAYIAVDGAFEPKEAHEKLCEWLPKYMVPASLTLLPAMPLNLSGKIDRGVLRAIVDKVEGRKNEREWLLPVEDIIADIFEDVLGVYVTTADDDFFELGGDSLLAIQVAIQLEQVLGRPIPPVLMAHGASPRQLAAAIDELPESQAEYLTDVQPLGDASALFCAPDVYGRSLSFTSLARRFTPHVPIFGLSTGPQDFGTDKKLNIEELLSQWAHVIREKQPEGPYHLCGFSFGGPIACALASLMEREGDEVMLCIIDSPLFRHLPSFGYFSRWAIREWRKSVAHLGVLDTLRAIGRTRHTWLRWFFPRKPFGRNDVANWIPKAYFKTSLALIEAVARHDLCPFGGKALLIQCREQPALSSITNEDGVFGWRGLLAGDSECITVDTTHYRLMQEPAIEGVASALFWQRASASTRTPGFSGNACAGQEGAVGWISVRQQTSG